MKKHKILLTAVSFFLLAGIVITAFAVTSGKRPHITAGKEENLIADRIHFSLENTQFTVKKSSDKPESYTLTMFFEAKKTQGDFYAVLDSFTLSGIGYDSIVFTALSEKAENKTTDSLLLTATNGEPDLFRWQVDINLSLEKKGAYEASVILNYTSGTSEDSATEKLREIPIAITVE